MINHNNTIILIQLYYNHIEKALCDAILESYPAQKHTYNS